MAGCFWGGWLFWGFVFVFLLVGWFFGGSVGFLFFFYPQKDNQIQKEVYKKKILWCLKFLFRSASGQHLPLKQQLKMKTLSGIKLCSQGKSDSLSNSPYCWTSDFTNTIILDCFSQWLYGFLLKSPQCCSFNIH